MDVVGIGIPNVDLLGHINQLPRENESASLLEYSWQGGGKVPTAIVALARLGVVTGMIGVVGDCCYGRFCIKDFQKHNVDVSKIIVDKGKTTPFAIVLSDDRTKGRNILYKQGTARKLLVEDIDSRYIKTARFLHLAEINDATIYAAQLAKDAGAKVVLDADWYNGDMEKILPFVDVFIASEFYYDSVYANKDYETGCRDILSKGPSIAVFTLGDKGCVAADKDGFYAVNGFRVEVIDTTGAGDVFHGGFIFGLLKGWDTPTTARFANAVAAIKCTRIGGRAAIPDFSGVKNFMEKGWLDYKEIDERVKYYQEGIGNSYE